ncbi:MAG: DNA polymerase sliding clamp [Desulfurococcales archaeon]|nr:DNA polymerase sliding clamp [Desulfurococcales archaeon]
MVSRIRFQDARTWRYIIASMEKVLDEGVFIANSEGLSFRSLDPARVVMVDLFFPAEAMSDYELEEDEVEFGVSFDTLVKVLRRARKNDELEIRVSDTFIDVLFLGRGSRRFRIPQITLSIERPPEPKIGFTVTAKMLATTFRESMRTLEPIADTLSLLASEESFIMRGTGDIESAELEFSVERQSLLDMQVESPDSSSYTLEYFSQMLQAAQAAETATVMYAGDAPARVDFEYVGGGRLTFYVSPTI